MRRSCQLSPRTALRCVLLYPVLVAAAHLLNAAMSAPHIHTYCTANHGREFAQLHGASAPLQRAYSHLARAAASRFLCLFKCKLVFLSCALEFTNPNGVFSTLPLDYVVSKMLFIISFEEVCVSCAVHMHRVHTTISRRETSGVSSDIQGM